MIIFFHPVCYVITIEKNLVYINSVCIFLKNGIISEVRKRTSIARLLWTNHLPSLDHKVLYIRQDWTR